ncbi:MAG: penicillin-binding protein 1C [Gemmatimonadaceae bacterium]|nr:penicillin-binding protein 1C [Gemmatimonadaceae bacterium]
MIVSRRGIALTVLGGVAVCAAATAAFIAWPLPRALTAPIAQPALTLTDRDGVVLRTTRAADGSRARWMPIGEMDAKLIAAFVAVEDRRYFSHGAVDWRAVARAAYHDARAGRVVSGASTIAMQTARLLHPTPRMIPGKVVQALWALRLGAHLSKQEMLEQYLNRIQLGQGAVGVESGASLYFGATAREVSVGQAAMLAGLAHAPSADNPLVSPRRAQGRRARALARMQGAGVASAQDVALAAEEPVLAAASAQRFLAPHFTTRFLAEYGDGSGGGAGEGDAAIRTSLDYALENDVELEVKRTVLDLRERGVEQAAAVVLDNRTGEVLAWVGSPNFWADTSGQTDMVISPRQPGSALKPFLYGLAFDRGFTPASILADIPHTYQTSTGPYHPRNYDRRFHGPVRARTALGSSYNIPAIELAQQLGAGSLLQTLHLAGFASLRESADYYGLGLALGNGDVSLLELANGYRSLANGGVWMPVTIDARVTRTERPSRSESHRVMTPLAAALVLDILADPVARAPGFGIESALEFPFPAAVKTGTSRHFTDNWAVATTAAFTVAVWVGNFNGRPMDGVSGVTGAGPLMHRVVMHAAERYEPGALPSPASVGAAQAEVCALSGLLVADGCSSLTEWFAPGTAPTVHDNWHRGGGVTLPAEYAEWRSQGGDAMLAAAGDSTLPATHVASSSGRAPSFHISSPRNGDRYGVPPGVEARFATIALRAEGADARTVHWFVDGRPTSANRLALVAGTHVIRASASGAQSDEVRVAVER